MLEVPNRDRQAERREATRREIVSTAWQVAREKGLAQLTLREVADRVGMRAPSLYTHFASKNAIYDAMFAEAWSEYVAVIEQLPRPEEATPRAVLRQLAHAFFDFAVADLARHQLMNQRTIPGFEPTPESYAPAVKALELFRTELAALGIDRPEDGDLCVAVTGGLVDAQLANDPGGDRWRRLVDRAVDMVADHLGLPPDPADARHDTQE